MQLNSFKVELEKIIDSNVIKYDEPMKKHVSFKVGGPCDVMIIPKDINSIIETIRLCKKYDIPFFIMGNGTNLIVRDGGYRGAIIKLTSLNNIIVNGNIIEAETGALLSRVSAEALKANLKGMEFASGIPGTVGGAVTMNAGAYGPEIKDIIEYAVVIDEKGEIKKLYKDELELSYRMSVIQKKNYIVIKAAFRLEEGNFEDIKARMEELNRRRSDKQPLEFPSAGSTFKRPDGYFAAKLIEDAGLKGFKVGGAMVSVKHSGFLINYNNATANEVLTLIERVQEIIYEKFSLNLEPEVKVIGQD